MKDHPHILAAVKFLSTDKGGRKGPTPPNIFRCIFEFEGEHFDCALLLGEGKVVSPGTNAKVPIVFLFPQYIKSRLKVGNKFTLRELGTIAEGVIEEILPD